MDPLVYQEIILGIVVLKITFHRLDLSWYSMYRDNSNYDNAYSILLFMNRTSIVIYVIVIFHTAILFLMATRYPYCLR